MERNAEEMVEPGLVAGDLIKEKMKE